MKYGMIIDLKRCYGCHACSITCKQKNATPPDVFWSRVYTKEVGTYPNVRREFQPSLCMHCQDAPCVEACHYGATTKREDGIVVIDQNACISCLRCIAACPYNARFYDQGNPKRYFPDMPETAYQKVNKFSLKPSKVSKCTFCYDRIDDKDELSPPACVQACPTHARIFGDLDSMEMQQKIIDGGGYQEQAEKGTNPSVYYLPEKP